MAALLDLVDAVALTFYSPFERCVMHALHAAGGADVRTLGEAELHAAVAGVRARTLRGALGRLQHAGLVRHEMVAREGERHPVRVWVLDVPRFVSAVGRRVDHLRRRLRGGQRAARCSACERDVDLDATFCCPHCLGPLDDVEVPAARRTHALDAIEELLRRVRDATDSAHV